MDGSTPREPDLTHWQGEPLGVWEALWAIPRLEAWTRLPSTNDRARRLAVEGAPAWTLVLAEEQTAGRGRAGKAWQSAPGAGLWASLVLRPRAAAQGALLPLLAGLALARALEDDPAGEGVGVGLKWPNDVWVDGRKVAGILCEAAGGAVVMGVGVNLRMPAAGFGPPHASTAGALETLTGRIWSGARLVGGLLRELRGLWEPTPLRFDGMVARGWAERDILDGRAVRVGGVRGIARGVTPEGALSVEIAGGGRVPVRAGHVEWLDAAGDER